MRILVSACLPPQWNHQTLPGSSLLSPSPSAQFLATADVSYFYHFDFSRMSYKDNPVPILPCLETSFHSRTQNSTLAAVCTRVSVFGYHVIMCFQGSLWPWPNFFCQHFYLSAGFSQTVPSSTPPRGGGPSHSVMWILLTLSLSNHFDLSCKSQFLFAGPFCLYL